MQRMMCLWAGLLLLLLQPLAEESADPDQDYVAQFLEKFSKVDPTPTLEAYATPERYDARFLGDAFAAALEKVSNDTGALAWGGSYRMMSLNGLYRVTGDTKYLDANRQYIQAALAATDEKRGMKLWTGATVAAWGCEKYAQRGRAVFAVHTGIITAPIFEFLLLAKAAPGYLDSLGDDFEAMLEGAQQALAVHDRQWRDGPGEAEGHYIGLDQEEVCENKPLPGNRLSAMGWALWLSWKVSGNTSHRDRAIALGHYFKNRVTPSPEGAYFWPYWLPEARVTEAQPREAVEGEDSSHAGLTLRLALVLAADGQVFTAEDLKAFAKTVTQGFARRNDGILISRITGTTELKPSYIGAPAKWLGLAATEPEVGRRIVRFYLDYKPNPGPDELAQLIQYQRQQHR